MDDPAQYALFTQLSLADDGSAQRTENGGARSMIEAFLPQAPSSLRARVILRLARQHAANVSSPGSGDTSLASLLRPSLRDALQQQSGDAAHAFAAIRLTSTLYAFAEQEAHALLFDKGDLLCDALRWIEHDWQMAPLVAFAVTELLNVAISSAESRKAFIKLAHGGPKVLQGMEGRSVEMHSEDAAGILETIASPLDWLAAVVERAELENPKPTEALSSIALMAALALHKLMRSSDSSKDTKDPGGLQGKQSKKEDTLAEGSNCEEEDAFLFELGKRHIELGNKAVPSFAALSKSSFPVDASTAEELCRLCQLCAIEGLSYLSLQSHFRDAVVDDAALLQAICDTGKSATRTSSNSQPRLVFPIRDGSVRSSTAARSAYELNNTLTSANTPESPDIALQFGVSTLFASVMSYPIVKSKDEEQMEKLRNMANAGSVERRATNGDTDERMNVPLIERRVARVIDAHGIEVLSAIVAANFSSDQSITLNSSRGVQRAASSALLAATTRQDKRQRGIIIQQGGARALLLLANHSAALMVQQQADGDDGAAATTSSDAFNAAQGLAHLLITEDPSIVLNNPVDAVPALVLLYLHQGASRLQHFEAALALTNLASLSIVLASRIAQTAYARAMLRPHSADDFVGADRDENKGPAAKESVASVLWERIFVEENELSRRSSLELLCNLLSVEEVHARWSGETEDESESAAAQSHLIDSRATHDLTFLVALCAPAGLDAVRKDTGLRLRLAAAGVVAMLCSSASTCARLLVLEARVLNKISRLIEPTTAVVQLHGTIVELTDGDGDAFVDEEEEAALHREDLESDPQGVEYAQWQLALRGLTCIECLTQYVAWMREQGQRDGKDMGQVLVASGAVKAIKALAREGTLSLKRTSSNAGSKEELQTQITKQALSVLKAMQSIGVLH